MTMPDFLPGYIDLQLGSTGEVWAQRFTMPSADSVRWDVFRPDGIYAGRVMVPASFQVWEIGRDDVLGIARDELDVERVQVYRLGGVRGAAGTEARTESRGQTIQGEGGEEGGEGQLGP